MVEHEPEKLKVVVQIPPLAKKHFGGMVDALVSKN